MNISDDIRAGDDVYYSGDKESAGHFLLQGQTAKVVLVNDNQIVVENHRGYRGHARRSCWKKANLEKGRREWQHE